MVGDDEREEKPNDGRALLNLGHTFGHALEAEYGYDGGLLHGEGVAIGLGLAFKLSARLGHCSAEDAERVVAHVAAVGMPADLSMLNRRFSAATLIGHMRRDKKVRDGALHFVLVRGIGQAFTVARRAAGRGEGVAARRRLRRIRQHLPRALREPLPLSRERSRRMSGEGEGDRVGTVYLLRASRSPSPSCAARPRPLPRKRERL